MIFSILTTSGNLAWSSNTHSGVRVKSVIRWRLEYAPSEPKRTRLTPSALLRTICADKCVANRLNLLSRFVMTLGKTYLAAYAPASVFHVKFSFIFPWRIQVVLMPRGDAITREERTTRRCPGERALFRKQVDRLQ